tara:strand:- start:853 stop:1134 length:282 start_codon:yes stop_codon:yes gene_type:complete
MAGTVEMVCITLLLYVNGEVASHVGYHKMVDCLKQKRIAEKTHEGDEPHMYTCQKRLVEVGKDADGNDYIVRLLDTDENPEVKAESVTEKLGG